MAGRNRKRRGYKFTEKTQSKKGIAAFGLAAISVCILVYGGNGSMYLGSAGVCSMLLSFVAAAIAVQSLKEEESFKLFPYLGTVTSFLAAITWIAIYAAGMLA